MSKTQQPPESNDSSEKKPRKTVVFLKEELSGQVSQIRFNCYKAHNKKGHIIQDKQECGLYDKKSCFARFNEFGAITEMHIFERGKLINITYYNDLGKEVECIIYNPSDGKITHKIYLTYDEMGANIETLTTDADGQMMSKRYLENDEKERIFKNITLGLNGLPNHINYQTCDGKGHLIESKGVSANDTISSWWTYKNDERGHPVEMTSHNQDGSIKETHHFANKYDSEGKIIGPNYYKKQDSEMCTYEYINDEHSNWFKKIEFYNNVPLLIYYREISYFDEQPENNLSTNNQITENTITMEKEEIEDTIKEENHQKTQMNAEQVKWLAEASSADNISAFRYFVLANNYIPSSKSYMLMNIEVIALMEELKENMSAEVIHSQNLDYGNYEDLIRYTLSFPHKGYLLQTIQIQRRDADEYEVPRFISQHHNDYGSIYVSQLTLLRPPDNSNKRDEHFEYELQEYIEKCTLKKVPDKPEIYMIQVSDGNFDLESHAVNDDFEIKNLDMNYGYGFENFHNDLMHRFQTETKGLVLFHGEPGTGKTYYIRHLLRSMASNKKIVIYMPPNLVDHLVEPSFLTFLSQEISRYSDQGYFCALLIEDAEPLLASRQTEGRIQGVSNLLNMTDGLLNDMLNMQIICTFNVKLKELDKALLRPGRLIARKEFKKMPALDANILAQQLGVKHHFTKPVTIAEVYALVKNKNTLEHNVGDIGDDE